MWPSTNPYNTIHDENLNVILTPEQQQFILVYLKTDLLTALEQTNTTLEQFSQWHLKPSFSRFVRELEDRSADNVYRQVILVAEGMLQEIRNLSEHMTIPERAEAMASIVKLVTLAREKRRYVHTVSDCQNYYDARKWRKHKGIDIEEEDDDEDYEEEEEEEEEEEDSSTTPNSQHNYSPSLPAEPCPELVEGRGQGDEAEIPHFAFAIPHPSNPGNHTWTDPEFLKWLQRKQEQEEHHKEQEEDPNHRILTAGRRVFY